MDAGMAARPLGPGPFPPPGVPVLGAPLISMKRLRSVYAVQGWILAAAAALLGFVALEFWASGPPGSLSTQRTIQIYMFSMLAASMGAVGGWSLARSRRMFDVEIAPGKVRLPLRKQTPRGGWRDVGEILWMEAVCTPEAREAALAYLASQPARRVSLFEVRAALRGWKGWGGMLVVTEDEAIVIPGSSWLLQQVVFHWRFERARPA